MLAAKRTKAVTKKLPREALRDLINRSGLSVAELARLADYKSTSGLHKYLTDAQGDKLIPYDVIKKISDHIAGRGTPPVTYDELYSISTASALAHEQHLIPQRQKLDVAPGRPLQVRHRAEAGVFMDDTTRRARNYGDSNLLPVVKYPANAQWAVVDADATKPTTLHCVDLDEIPVHRRYGRQCVAKVEREKSGLFAVLIVPFKQDGKPERGVPLGVVVATYTEV